MQAVALPWCPALASRAPGRVHIELSASPSPRRSRLGGSRGVLLVPCALNKYIKRTSSKGERRDVGNARTQRHSAHPAPLAQGLHTHTHTHTLASHRKKEGTVTREGWEDGTPFRLFFSKRRRSATTRVHDVADFVGGSPPSPQTQQNVCGAPTQRPLCPGLPRTACRRRATKLRLRAWARRRDVG